MEFLVFRRACSALIVAPAFFRPPVAFLRQWPVRLICRCDLELDEFSPPLAAEIAEHGFAVARDGDLQLLEARLTQPVPAAPRSRSRSSSTS